MKFRRMLLFRGFIIIGWRVGDGVAIMNCNISARKQMELALRESGFRLKMIVEGTRPTWEWNVQTGETLFNERWAEMLGYTLAANSAPVDINTWRARVHPDDLVVAEQLTNYHFAGLIPYYECEVRMRHQDGHWVWVWDLGRVTTRLRTAVLCGCSVCISTSPNANASRWPCARASKNTG